MNHYSSRYIYSMPFGTPTHQWELVGRWGGVNLHISDYGKEHTEDYDRRCSGGLEFHYREPPEYMSNQPPSHSPCWLLHCPCWHDGTSLFVSEYIIPRWSQNQMTHEQMWSLLERSANEKFLGRGG